MDQLFSEIAMILLFVYNIPFKGDKMDKKESLKASRRGFICVLSGMVSLAVLASPKGLLAKKTQIKTIITNLELEIVERARPQKEPSVTEREQRGETCLFRKTDGQAQPLCTLNDAGKVIWQACDGENNPRAISRLVRQAYQVSSQQAYADCLNFLVQLRRIGAIQF